MLKKLLMPLQMLEDGARREQTWTYPNEAVRETIVNALVHRDYPLSGATVELSIYKDRLEVISPGRLPNGITPQRMVTGCRSARNQLLKDVMRDYGYLEHMGIHALERAGRKDEIIPLCETEAKKTGNYERIVNLLVSARRYEEAEGWIREGIGAIKDKWPGTAAGLRNQFREIRTRQKNWSAVAAIHAEDFIRQPSRQTYSDCKKASSKVKAWPGVCEHLLRYLEKGELPWKQKAWPLPDSGLDVPESGRKDRFPMVNELIELAILEKKPERVLYWYDQLPKKRNGWYG